MIISESYEDFSAWQLDSNSIVYIIVPIDVLLLLLTIPKHSKYFTSHAINVIYIFALDSLSSLNHGVVRCQ